MKRSLKWRHVLALNAATDKNLTDKSTVVEEYLVSSHYINWRDSTISQKAQQLAQGAENKIAIAENCFLFVRDDIKHSWDFRMNPVTCRASEVLMHGTGFCFAKSHLLAALLRANDIPAGLCYQRLTLDGKAPPFTLHGFNAIFLDDVGWYRVDARGNKPGVLAEFNPPEASLAFDLVVEGEYELPGIWSEPMPLVTNCLERCTDLQDILDNLPDLPPEPDLPLEQ